MFKAHFTFECCIVRWLDSSKTLFEQDVNEGDLLYLRFKYYPFMDIDPRVCLLHVLDSILDLFSGG